MRTLLLFLLSGLVARLLLKGETGHLGFSRVNGRIHTTALTQFTEEDYQRALYLQSKPPHPQHNEES